MRLRTSRGAAAIAAIAAAATLAAPGAASAADADSCQTELARGYILDTFLVVGFDRSVPEATRVCFRVDDGRGTNHGRVYTITTPGASVGVPRVDASWDACGAAVGNQAPGPHPALAGTIGGQPVHADTYSGGGETWVCVRAGAVMLRVIVPSQDVQPPTVSSAADTGPRPAREIYPMPSNDCFHGGQEYLNMRFGSLDSSFAGIRFVLGTRQTSPTTTDVCVRARRLRDPVDVALGGRLTVDTGRADIRPTIEVAEDIAGCTIAFVDLTAPTRVFAGLSGTGALPVSACVQTGSFARRVTIGTTGGVVVPTVTWSPDP